MNSLFPFLTQYDPQGTSEGTLDPMGLYQIADQLAIYLVPAVRERMQRIRFLTAMAVGAKVTEKIEANTESWRVAPYLVWEWLFVEAFIRTRNIREDFNLVWGVPGSDVTQRALDQHGYLDDRSYLKTPRVFGFNGVYKRLAIRLEIVDVNLRPGPNTDRLVDAWARTLGLGGIDGARPMLERWSDAVTKSLREQPPRTKPGWTSATWAELANAFAPDECKGKERQFLREQLCATDDRRLGALPDIWKLQSEFVDGDYREETLHDRLEKIAPSYAILLKAIRAYESFARGLQDAFDILRMSAGKVDSEGFSIPEIESNSDFAESVDGLHNKFVTAYHLLCEVRFHGFNLSGLFTTRFKVFEKPMVATDFARAICHHHEEVQRAKSEDGKRAWFDRIGEDRIYIRHQYRQKEYVVNPQRYVHFYRGLPIRRFYEDLK